MVHEKTNVVIGVLSYALGVVFGLNFFSSLPNFSFHPAVELAIISVWVLCMSIFFYAQFSFFLLFLIGVFFSPLAYDKPLFVALAVLPLSLANYSGVEIGISAKEDFFGRKNIYEYKLKFFAMALIVVLVAVLAGVIPEYFAFSIPK